jgi:hypothetical protein
MIITRLAAAALVALALAAPAGATESPPTGIPPSEFATNYKGCLGKLRSALAQGLPVGPFANGFGPGVNPGVHQGTVGEEEFLRTVILPLLPPGTTLEALCASFE